MTPISNPAPRHRCLSIRQPWAWIGEIGEAMTFSSRLLKIDKDNPLAYVQAHEVAMRKNKAKLAKKYIKKALDLHPAIGRIDGE